MATIADYLTSLQDDRDTLATNIQTKGVATAADDTFTDLAAKVLLIPDAKTITEQIEETLEDDLSDVTVGTIVHNHYTYTVTKPTEQTMTYTYNSSTGDVTGETKPMISLSSNVYGEADGKRITVWQKNAENTGWECSLVCYDKVEGEIQVNKVPFNATTDLYWGVDTDTVTWKYFKEEDAQITDPNALVKLPYVDITRTTERTNGSNQSLNTLRSRVVGVGIATMDAIMDPIFNEYVQTTYSWDPAGDTSLETEALKRDTANSSAFQTYVNTNHASDIIVYCTKVDNTNETVTQLGTINLLDAYIDYRNKYQIGGTTYWMGPQFTIYETEDAAPNVDVIMSRTQITTYADAQTALTNNVGIGYVHPVYYRSDDMNATIKSTLVQPLYVPNGGTVTLAGDSILDIDTGYQLTGWTDWTADYSVGDTVTVNNYKTFRALIGPTV